MPLALHAMAPPVRLLPTRRRARGPWTPMVPPGPYALPRAILERLTAVLAPFRNRDSALALASFLARFWSAPSRIVRAFPLDRRALTDHAALGLTEARVRGAIATLELVGFLDRDTPPAGSRYKATAEGLHRRPILWRFGGEFVPAFTAANARTQGNRGTPSPVRRPIAPRNGPLPSWSNLSEPGAISPKAIHEVVPVIMGEMPSGSASRGFARERVAPIIEPHSPLEMALARLGGAILTLGSRDGEAK